MLHLCCLETCTSISTSVEMKAGVDFEKCEVRADRDYDYDALNVMKEKPAL